jgi:hypothetical protein
MGESVIIGAFSYSFAHININSVGIFDKLLLTKSKIIFGGIYHDLQHT